MTFPTHRPSTQIRRDFEEMKKLSESRGWAVIEEVLAKEASLCVRQITSMEPTSREQLDVMRATLRALNLMQGLPALLLQNLESELKLAAIHEPAPEGKA